MSPYLSYQDILLVPEYSELVSRDDADVSVVFLKRKFKLPVIPANMLSVIDINIAKYLAFNDYFYIYHRFGDLQKNGQCSFYEFVLQANRENWPLISISIGTTSSDIQTLGKLKEESCRVDFITLDVAHGHHLLVKNSINSIKTIFPDVPLIVGNVATWKAVRDLGDWGADCIKVGIGQGSVCTTRFETGFSVPMFSCALECSQENGWVLNDKKIPEFLSRKNVPIIADGGIQARGDIAKALVAGAKMVMCGGLFAACSDSPASINENGQKIYFGSSSYETKGKDRYIEGKSVLCRVDVPYEVQLNKIKEALKSAVSYAGGRDLSVFKSIGWVNLK